MAATEPLPPSRARLPAQVAAWTALWLLCFALSVGAARAEQPTYRDGDLVFQTSTSGQSKAISLATGSPWTHVGVIFVQEGRPMVFEAVQPVRTTPLDRWIRRGVGNRYVVKRLRDPSPLRSSFTRKSMWAWASRQAGKRYDLKFAWSDDKMYCSELVWKLYKEVLGIELAPLQTVASFSLGSPAVKQQLRKRWPDGIPAKEPLIAPAGLFDSPLLVEVRK